MSSKTFLDSWDGFLVSWHFSRHPSTHMGEEGLWGCEIPESFRELCLWPVLNLRESFFSCDSEFDTHQPIWGVDGWGNEVLKVSWREICDRFDWRWYFRGSHSEETRFRDSWGPWENWGRDLGEELCHHCGYCLCLKVGCEFVYRTSSCHDQQRLTLERRLWGSRGLCGTLVVRLETLRCVNGLCLS